MSYGENFLSQLFGSNPENAYTLKSPANTIPGKYLRELAEKNLDKDFLRRYLDEPSYMNDLNTIPEGLLRDALVGAQRAGRGIKNNFGAALINRLNAYKSPVPYQTYSKTGEDYYRLLHPDEIIIPYAKSYNDEQQFDR